MPPYAGSTGAGSLPSPPDRCSAALEVGKPGQVAFCSLEDVAFIASRPVRCSIRSLPPPRVSTPAMQLADLGQPLNGGADPQLDIGVIAAMGIPQK